MCIRLTSIPFFVIILVFTGGCNLVDSSDRIIPASKDLMRDTWVDRDELEILLESRSMYSFIRSFNPKELMAIRFSHDAPFLSSNEFIFFGFSNGSINQFRIDENGIIILDRPKAFVQEFGNTELYFKTEGKDTVLYCRVRAAGSIRPYYRIQKSLENVALSKLIAGKYWIDAKPANQVTIKSTGSIIGLENYKSLKVVFPYKESPPSLDLLRLYKNKSVSDWYGWRISGQELHLYYLGQVSENEKIPEMNFDLDSLSPKYKLFIALL